MAAVLSRRACLLSLTDGHENLKPRFSRWMTDGQYAALSKTVGLPEYDHVTIIAPEFRRGHQATDSLTLLSTNAACADVMAKLEASVPGMQFRSVDDALSILKNKRVLYIGDSLTRGAFRDLCYFLGGTSPSGKVQQGQPCTPGTKMAAANVQLASRWIPYVESEFTRANFTDVRCYSL